MMSEIKFDIMLGGRFKGQVGIWVESGREYTIEQLTNKVFSNKTLPKG